MPRNLIDAGISAQAILETLYFGTGEDGDLDASAADVAQGNVVTHYNNGLIPAGKKLHFNGAQSSKGAIVYFKDTLTIAGSIESGGVNDGGPGGVGVGGSGEGGDGGNRAGGVWVFARRIAATAGAKIKANGGNGQSGANGAAPNALQNGNPGAAGIGATYRGNVGAAPNGGGGGTTTNGGAGGAAQAVASRNALKDDLAMLHNDLLATGTFAQLMAGLHREVTGASAGGGGSGGADNNIAAGTGGGGGGGAAGGNGIGADGGAGAAGGNGQGLVTAQGTGGGGNGAGGGAGYVGLLSTGIEGPLGIEGIGGDSPAAVGQPNQQGGAGGRGGGGGGGAAHAWVPSVADITFIMTGGAGANPGGNGFGRRVDMFD